MRAANWPTSAWVLLVANLLPLAGVWLLGWKVFDLLILFWLENVIIGVVNVLRLILVPVQTGQRAHTLLFLIPFFIVHYGGFAYGHGLAVIHLFGDQRVANMSGLWSIFRDPQLALAAVALLVSHVVSLILNDVRGKELQHQSLRSLMARPYRRVVVLQMTILAGGFAVSLLGSPLWALLVLLGIKASLDLRQHLRDHPHATIMN